MEYFKKLDLSHARDVYVVGDIHGCFSLLENKLEQLGFDKSQDHLISVGDLVDRGPESHLAVEYAQMPWFHYVLGNHEFIAASSNRHVTCYHVDNGGAWFKVLDESERQPFIDILMDAPIILEVTTPSGATIGVIHAACPTDVWNSEKLAETVTHYIDYCTWDRRNVKNPYLNGISGIDHVYHGHNVLDGIKTVANVTWLDTGAVFTGNMTIVKAP